MIDACELTERERQVLVLVARGLANAEIAERLGIKEKTVKTHLRLAFEKTYVINRTEAAIYALRNGMVSVDDAWSSIAERRGLSWR